MKKHISLALLSLALIVNHAIAQSKTSAQEVNTPQQIEEREAVKKAIMANYIGIKNSLLISDAKKTSEYANAFAKTFAGFKFKKLTLEEMNAATTARKEITSIALRIAEKDSINAQRKDMEQLSALFWPMVDKLKAEKTLYYQQRCPMTGATWISDEKEIKNPYYPKNMLTCGEIVAEK